MQRLEVWLEDDGVNPTVWHVSEGVTVTLTHPDEPFSRVLVGPHDGPWPEHVEEAADEDDLLLKLSYARTALDDPSGLPDSAGVKEDWISRADYAIEKIDEAIEMLDIELRPSRVLTTTGRLIAQVAEEISDSGDLDAALDLIDGVIASLERHDDD